MENRCEWCECEKIMHGSKSVFWELPDGSRAIEITHTPTITCQDCHISYQTEKIVKQIEDQLFLVNTTLIDKTIKFEELMALPRLLKRNYFDFSS
ncbi:YokU family protein [Bacillus sp. T33-2]|uniref:YokU family protein n=1 Tax=Bacillus sp. T33-2 TaxID=2054168 RepID=UPI000C770D45|nr:YokU family protein [Bacillus sp. T33-2]PLR98868.1 YokU family protein [Bacillus sp. T33-2]